MEAEEGATDFFSTSGTTDFFATSGTDFFSISGTTDFFSTSFCVFLIESSLIAGTSEVSFFSAFGAAIDSSLFSMTTSDFLMTSDELGELFARSFSISMVSDVVFTGDFSLISAV